MGVRRPRHLCEVKETGACRCSENRKLLCCGVLTSTVNSWSSSGGCDTQSVEAVMVFTLLVLSHYSVTSEQTDMIHIFLNSV